jgi:hypothetical protein
MHELSLGIPNSELGDPDFLRGVPSSKRVNPNFLLGVPSSLLGNSSLFARGSKLRARLLKLFAGPPRLRVRQPELFSRRPERLGSTLRAICSAWLIRSTSGYAPHRQVAGTRPNNSFKPKTNRCAIVFGLIQALGRYQQPSTVNKNQ